MNMNMNTDNGHQKDHMYAKRGPNGHVVLKKPLLILILKMHSE